MPQPLVVVDPIEVGALDPPVVALDPHEEDETGDLKPPATITVLPMTAHPG